MHYVLPVSVCVCVINLLSSGQVYVTSAAVSFLPLEDRGRLGVRVFWETRRAQPQLQYFNVLGLWGKQSGAGDPFCLATL